MDHTLFYELTSVLLVAGLIAMLTSLLKQPSIIAFIITGLIVGPLGYYQLHSTTILNSLGEVGITLLLFMVGLELDVKVLRKLGKVALTTGIGQILFTTIVGFSISKLLGFTLVESVYIAFALTFSSTIIVVKLLAEKKDLQSLYARIVIGILVVQDFIAMIILLFLGGTESSKVGFLQSLPVWQILVITLVKALIFVLLLMWLSRRVFPYLLKYLGKSEELLLSFSLAWALGLAAFASLPWVGFSLEMGGFLAGLALANTEIHYEISAKIKSIRDFFIIIFFIVFGTQLVLGSWSQIAWPAVILSLFVLIGNPLIVMVIMGYLGYKPRTGFFASVAFAQVSEFSFILVALGYRLGHVSASVVSLVTLVGVITIALSSYMILYSHDIFELLKPVLKYFDFKKGSAEKSFANTVLKDHVVLVGAHRLGAHLIEALENADSPLVVVDFNPEIVQKFEQQGVMAVCGDVTDSYIQDQVNIENAKLVISTIPDFKDNLTLLDAVNLRSQGKNHRPKLIFAAQDEEEAKHLYSREIDYALSPHFIGGLHLAKILSDSDIASGLQKLKQHHLKVLNS